MLSELCSSSRSPCRQFSSKYSASRKKVKYLELEGGEVLYGIQPVKMCLRAARRTVHCIYYNPGSQRARLLAEEGRERGLRVEELDRQGLEVICQAVDRYKEHHVHQGIVADVSKLYYQPLDYSMPQVKQSLKVQTVFFYFFHIKIFTGESTPEP